MCNTAGVPVVFVQHPSNSLLQDQIICITINFPLISPRITNSLFSDEFRFDQVSGMELTFHFFKESDENSVRWIIFSKLTRQMSRCKKLPNSKTTKNTFPPSSTFLVSLIYATKQTLILSWRQCS